MSMKKRILLFAGLTAALLFAGCGKDTNTSDTEALQRQIAQLEEKVAQLEQQNTAAASAGEVAGDTGSLSPSDTEAPADTTAQASDTAPAEGQTVQTTYTMEELTDMVDAYVNEINTLSQNGSNLGDTEQFFAYKQEEKQIDNYLDIHEDELEAQYRSGALTRDEYKTLERELERLEDRLDDAEDQLEYIFGIDD